MAQRRMMSDKVIKTDSFMEMPHSTKNLYFYLMIEADDDGFVSNPKTIMRMVNAAEDDYKILVGKRFIIPFESGVCVIKHWLIHNLIRADRKIDTQWTEEMKLLVVDDETRKYSLNQGPQPNDNQVTTKCPPRLGKVRLGKDSIEREVASLSFLEKLPEATKVQLSEKYHVSPKGIQSKATDLLLYCKQNGKKYKDYKSFLENALRKDKSKLQTDFPLMVVKKEEQEPELTPEQIEKNRVIREQIGLMLKK